MEPVCYCGDVLDEHDPQTKACTVEGCRCFHFDEAPTEAPK